MKEDIYKKLIEDIKLVSELNNEQLVRLTYMVDDIINSNNTDEKYISFVFDHLLSISFVDFNILKEVYIKLVNYVRGFNKELADDYWHFFIEDFELDEEKNKDLPVKQSTNSERLEELLLEPNDSFSYESLSSDLGEQCPVLRKIYPSKKIDY